MTSMKFILAGALIAVTAWIQSADVEAWAKLTAVPVLGAVIIALLFFNDKQHKATLASHERVCEGIREDNKTNLNQTYNLLKNVIED